MFMALSQLLLTLFFLPRIVGCLYLPTLKVICRETFGNKVMLIAKEEMCLIALFLMLFDVFISTICH